MSRRSLDNDGLVDRDSIWPLKRAVLRDLFDRFADDEEFTRWRAEQDPALEQFATWCAMTDHHGADQHAWPAGLRRPDSPDVAAFASVHRGDVAFHGWLQRLMSCQLTEAAGDMTVVQDLPIGVDPGGFDAWAWTDLLATDVTVGAPPDPFNLRGQDWGLPPFVPWRLRQADYQPFIDSIRATIAAGGGLRIDHVMGLFRLWWIPSGAEPTRGGYVRYPADDLLDIVALESVRANALVIGEDLGTVEPGVRETLAARNILFYKLFWFEDDPAQWPVSAMGALSTHDLPTVPGLWTGADLAEQRRSGVEADDDSTTALRDKLAAATGLPSTATVSDAVVAAYRVLGTAPCLLLGATLDDAVGARSRPNIPGTTERANWSVPLPVRLDDLPGHPGAAAVAAVLRDAVAESVTQPE